LQTALHDAFRRASDGHLLSLVALYCQTIFSKQQQGNSLKPDPGGDVQGTLHSAYMREFAGGYAFL
jgi:hypothetical protein